MGSCESHPNQMINQIDCDSHKQRVLYKRYGDANIPTSDSERSGAKSNNIQGMTGKKGRAPAIQI